MQFSSVCAASLKEQTKRGQEEKLKGFIETQPSLLKIKETQLLATHALKNRKSFHLKLKKLPEYLTAVNGNNNLRRKRNAQDLLSKQLLLSWRKSGSITNSGFPDVKEEKSAKIKVSEPEKDKQKEEESSCLSFVFGFFYYVC